MEALQLKKKGGVKYCHKMIVVDTFFAPPLRRLVGPFFTFAAKINRRLRQTSTCVCCKREFMFAANAKTTLPGKYTKR